MAKDAVLPVVEGADQKRHWVRLTRMCNQRCLFCLDREAQTGINVALEDVRRDLADGREAGLSRVVLSGGEPTIHPRFLEIVALARDLGYTHIQIITNGRRLCYRRFLGDAVAAGLHEITFSLHGHTNSLHDRLTRVPGSFVQAVAGLRHALATPGLIVSVDVVITKLNLPHLREILEFFNGLGVWEFDLLALVPFSDAWKNHVALFCDFTEPANISQLRRALELSKRPGVHLWTNRLRADLLEGYEGLIQSPEKIHDEVRGRRKVFSDYLTKGEMACQGPNCRYCFLKDFCADLAALIKDGALDSRRGPLCLPEAQSSSQTFPRARTPDMGSFTEFYIRSRYFVKGSACAACILAGSCDGAPVSEVRARGFGALHDPSPVEAR
jgi:MoaA/NifB/PqqE/SkfB family radical SAM enzyme